MPYPNAPRFPPKALASAIVIPLLPVFGFLLFNASKLCKGFINTPFSEISLRGGGRAGGGEEGMDSAEHGGGMY